MIKCLCIILFCFLWSNNPIICFICLCKTHSQIFNAGVFLCLPHVSCAKHVSFAKHCQHLNFSDQASHEIKCSKRTHRIPQNVYVQPKKCHSPAKISATIKTGTLRIIRPVAQLKSSHLSQVLYKLGTKCKRQWRVPWFELPAPDLMHNTSNLFTTQLKLDKNLRLNLTIQELHIPESVYIIRGPKCTKGLIRVQSNSKNKLAWDFCGFLSHTSIYPVSSHVTILSLAKPFVFINASLLFVIIDPNILVSQVVDGRDYRFPIWSFDFPNTDAQILNYKVVIPRTECVYIQITRGVVEAIVHDGPGKKSKSLKNIKMDQRNVYYISSSFCAVIYCVIPMNLTNQKENIWLATVDNKDIFPLSVFVSQAKQTYTFPHPQLCVQKYMCVVNFQSDSKHTVNITLSNITYEGDANTEECDYAAVVAKSSPYKEYDTICVKQYEHCNFKRDCYGNTKYNLEGQHYLYLFDIDCRSHRYPGVTDTLPVHSAKSSLLFMVYSFPEYGTLTTTVDASTTLCTVTTIDICEGRNFFVWPYPDLYSVSWNRLNRVKRIMLKWRAGCIVFHFKAELFERKRDLLCKLELAAENSGQLGNKFSISGTGHIAGL